MILMGSVRSFVSHFARPYWVWYVAGTLALAATTLISLWIPQLSKQIVDSLNQLSFDSKHQQTALSIIALGFTLVVARSLSRVLLFWPGQKVAADTRSWIVRRFLRLRQEYLVHAGLGDLISRLSNDVVHLRLMCGFGLLQLLNMVFMLVFSVTLMWRTDPLLTVLALAPVSAMLLVTYAAMPAMARYSREQQNVIGQLTNKVTESFVNVQTVQTHVAFESFERRIESENQENFRVSIRLLFIRTLTFPLMMLFTGLSEVIVLLVGGYKVLSGGMTVGDILTFNIYVGILSWPLAAVGILISIVQRAGTALQRLKEVELAPQEDMDVDLIQPEAGVPANQGRKPDSYGEAPVLQVIDLNFTHGLQERSDRLALSHISFELRPGERLGVCGPVGAGKSTLFSLITRVYEPPRGAIFLHGVDVRDERPQILRQNVRHLGQSVHLFSDSVRRNLIFGVVPEPSEAAVRTACEHAQVWTDICSLPKGLDTEIGERGVRLSGGQKQRLAIARMLLRPAQIFLFDDVLSAVDTRTEAALLDVFFNLNVSFIISSHRESTLLRCDRVLYLEGGRMTYLGAPFAGIGSGLTGGVPHDEQPGIIDVQVPVAEEPLSASSTSEVI
jgi:ATP-binding cassette subfamily B multidrug efflux pump